MSLIPMQEPLVPGETYLYAEGTYVWVEYILTVVKPQSTALPKFD